MVKYVYDAWGNVKTYSYDGNELVDHSHIGYINPFRYRGYYYDTETKLYYLKTRYYDPEVGRFITIDDLSYLDPEHINGLNLYAYCGNNPVMAIDPDGTKWWKKFKNWVKKNVGWIATVAVAIVAVTLVIVGTVITGGILGTLVGGVLVGAGMGFLGGASASIYVQGKTNGWNNIDPFKVLQSGGIGAAIGAVTGLLTSGLGVIAKEFGKTIGFHLSNMSVCGLNVGKAFDYLGGTEMLMSVMGFVGKTVGVLFGGGAINKLVNDLFGRESTLEQNMNDSGKNILEDWALGWIIRIFQWI